MPAVYSVVDEIAELKQKRRAVILAHHYQIDENAASLLSPVTAHAGDVESGSFGNEVDLALDWTVNPHVGVSTVLAIFEPTHGGRTFLGDDETWVGWMLYATLKF